MFNVQNPYLPLSKSMSASLRVGIAIVNFVAFIDISTCICRFHLARLLTQLSASTGRYAPVLPYYLDILRTFDFSKKTKKVSMKPMNFSCILRLSKSQMTENVYKDAVVEQVWPQTQFFSVSLW